MSKSNELLAAVKRGSASQVEQHVWDGFSSMDYSKAALHKALAWAIGQRRPDMVRILLATGRLASDKSVALRKAVEAGCAECVELLIPASNPKSQNSEALRMAAELGFANCVRLLRPCSQVAGTKHHALRIAAVHGHAECVEELARDADDEARQQALFNAMAYREPGCVEVLLRWTDPRAIGPLGMSAAAHAKAGGNAQILDLVERWILAAEESAILHEAALPPMKIQGPVPRL